MSDSYQIEMLWDCTQCTRKANRGRYKNCEGCGEPQQGHEVWYMPGDTSRAAAVTDPEQLRHAKAGKDWSCSHCGGNQRDLDGNCNNCGGAKIDPFAHIQRVPDRDYQHHIPYERAAIDPGFRYAEIGRHALIACVCLALISLAYFLLREVDKEVTVKQASWEHIIHVERYQPISQSGFDEDMPSDATSVTKNGKRHHHYDRRQVGTRPGTCYKREACGRSCSKSPTVCTPNNNGHATCTGGVTSCTTDYCQKPYSCSKPVYKNFSIKEMHYSWIIWRWKHDRSRSSSGSGTEGLYWLSDADINLGSKERTKREVKYRTVFTDGEKDHKYRPESQNHYQELPPGSAHQVKYSIARGIRFPGKN